MKTHLKVKIGLTFLVIPLFLIAAWPQKAEAAVILNQQQIQDGLSTLEFQNRATIIGGFGGQNISFIDDNPFDTTYNYKPSGQYFCSTGQTINGITIRNNAISEDKFGNVASSVPAFVDLDVNPNGTTSKNGCSNTTPDDLPADVRTNGKAFIGMAWANQKLSDFSGVKNASTLSQLSNTAAGRDVYVKNTSGECFGEDIVILSNDNQGVRYKLINSSIQRGPDASKDPKLGKYITQSGKCWIDSTFEFAILGDRATATGAGTGTVETDDPPEICYINSGASPIAWIACPLLGIGEDLANMLLGIFTDQLSFTVDQDLGDNDSQSRVKIAWSLVKNIASAGLVIVMLIMIFSQALGFGLFDAYTIRKMLPRLAVAAIAMQLSWAIFAFVVDFVNDIGNGLLSFMLLPFGGKDNLELDKLISAAGFDTVSAGVISWVGLLALIGLAAAALPMVLFLVFSAVVALLTALFTLVLRKILIITMLILVPLALLAWILPGTQRYWKLWSDNFLKALAMFPIIIAIIASGRIFAYVVGTQNQPDIVGGKLLSLILIMVGFFGPLFLLPKAFKWGGSAMVLAGNYANAAKGKFMERPKKYFDARQEGWSAERRRQSQERYKNDEGFNWRRPWRRPIDLARAGQLDPLLALQGRPRRLADISYKAAGAESERKDIEAANTAQQLVIERIHPDEQDAYARALAAGQVLKIDANGRIQATRYRIDDNGRLMRDGHGNLIEATGDEPQSFDYNPDGSINGAIGSTRASLLEERAGLDQITRLGGERNIEFVQSAFERAMNSGDTRRIEMMNKFTTANVQSLFSKLPHMYKNNNYAVSGHPEEHDVVRTVNGLNPLDITNLSGVGMRTLRNNLMTRANEGDADSIAALNRLTAVFAQASSDPSLRGRIPADVARTMRELSNGSIEITSPDGVARRMNVDPDWGINSTLNEIRNRVSADGIAVEAPTAPDTTTQPERASDINELANAIRRTQTLNASRGQSTGGFQNVEINAGSRPSQNPPQNNPSAPNVPPDTPPEDFREGGRYPPPNIPPGPQS